MEKDFAQTRSQARTPEHTPASGAWHLLVCIAEGEKSLELTSPPAPDPASVTVVQVIFLNMVFLIICPTESTEVTMAASAEPGDTENTKEKLKRRSGDQLTREGEGRADGGEQMLGPFQAVC